MNDKSPIIYYGIKPETEKEMDKFVSQTGEPVAFVIPDRWLFRFENKLFMGKYPVISLDEAIKTYPDAEYWVTYADIEPNKFAANLLIKKVAQEKFHFFYPNIEYRKGCNFLGHYINYGNDHFSVCCVTSKGTDLPSKGTIPERFSQWENYSTKLIDDIRNNRKNPCEKCSLLQYGFWPKEIKIDKFVLASSHPGDICNLKCMYCLASKKLDKAKKDKDDEFSTYEILCQLSEMPEYNTPKFFVHLANGEPCANKNQDKIFDLLLKTKWSIEVVSNMTIYREKFAQLMADGRVKFVLTSPDAGTRETYKKIKGADCFDRVVENLKKYPLDKVENFQMKYIFLEDVNDNIEDVDGFLNLVKEIGCKRIAISTDCFKPFTEKIRNLVARLIKKAKADNIMICQSTYLDPKDKKFIDECNSKPLNDTKTDEYSVNIIKNGKCIIDNSAGTSQIEGGGNLTLNANLVQGSAAECILKLGKASRLIINGDVKLEPNTFIELSDNATLTICSGIIKSGTIIKCANSIKIGYNVRISNNCYITDNEFPDNSSKTTADEPLVISDNVEIGYGTVINKPVEIPKDTVITPYSVVTNSFCAK